MVMGTTYSSVNSNAEQVRNQVQVYCWCPPTWFYYRMADTRDIGTYLPAGSITATVTWTVLPSLIQLLDCALEFLLP